jgi:hypothetical protein
MDSLVPRVVAPLVGAKAVAEPAKRAARHDDGWRVVGVR